MTPWNPGAESWPPPRPTSRNSTTCSTLSVTTTSSWGSRDRVRDRAKQPVIHATTFLDIGARNTLYLLRKTATLSKTSG